jgi:hypothetical protein
MTRASFVFRDGHFIPATKESPRNKSSLVGDEITGGIEHPATREIVYSRNHYKRITRAHGLEECYGEPDKYFQKEDDSEQRDKDLEDDVLKAMADLNYGEGLTEEELELCRQKNQAMEWEQD